VTLDVTDQAQIQAAVKTVASLDVPDRSHRHRHDPRLRDPQSDARVRRAGIFDGVAADEQDIFPDPTSASLADSWRGGAVKALERESAAIVEGEPVAA
jgi:hypothetical protein